jgi:diketogulonate reductase-like aldo/keto reductase
VTLGYRHIDTAQAYENEAGVGEGIRASGVPREQIFLTTKLAAEVKSYDETLRSIDGSLKALEFHTIDLMLIHSPQPWRRFGDADRFFEGNREAWRALEQAYRGGKLRSIGVSNFERVDLDNILGSCSVKPMVNQVLAHISNTPAQLIRYTQEQGILIEAYSPIAHGELLKNDRVTAIAERYGVSVPQLSIRYDLQLGLLPLPKTANPAHMKSNAAVDFVISGDDMEVLRNLPRIEDYGEASAMPVFGGKLT